MRILAGKHAGRHLTSPGRGVRPTTEVARDRVMNLLKDDLKGARVVDLFAGTGALGLEALSRGARFVDLVENGPAALHALKANVAALREQRRARIYKKDAIPFAESLEADAYDIAFVDPPYGSKKLDRVVTAWRARPFSRVLVLEHANDHELELKGKRYDFEGDTRMTVVRRKGQRPATTSGAPDRR